MKNGKIKLNKSPKISANGGSSCIDQYQAHHHRAHFVLHHPYHLAWLADHYLCASHDYIPYFSTEFPWCLHWHYTWFVRLHGCHTNFLLLPSSSYVWHLYRPTKLASTLLFLHHIKWSGVVTIYSKWVLPWSNGQQFSTIIFSQK